MKPSLLHLRSLFLLLIFVLSGRAEAMNIGLRTIPQFEDRSKTFETLVLSGEIVVGDAKKLEDFLRRSNQWHYDRVILDSAGGNVSEAIKMAELLREYLVTVIVLPPYRCGSACFFLYAGAASRLSDGPPEPPVLAIHRPYLQPPKVQSMEPGQVEEFYRDGLPKIRHWLQEQGVPQALIEKMFSLPSTGSYWLTREDIDAIGRRASWYEEWLLVRCPNYLRAESTLFNATSTASYETAKPAYVKAIACEQDAVGAARERAIQNRTSGTSKNGK